MYKVVFWNSSASRVAPIRYIGPHKISHWIKKNGISSRVLDYADKLDKDTLIKLTERMIGDETIVLAVSSTFIASNPKDIEHILGALREIKQTYPHIKIVTGGHSSEFMVSFDASLFDAVVQNYEGKSEDLFLEYVHYVEGKGPAPMRELGYVVPFFNAPRTTSFNIQYDDFKFSKENLISPEEALPIDVSRGCIFKCKFCRYLMIGKKKNDYVREVEYIRQEMLYNYENFGTTRYYILCDTFNDTRAKVEDFCEMVKTLPFKIEFVTYLRLDLLHSFDGTAEMLKEAGLVGAHFGIESFHPDASQAIGKGWNGKFAKDYLIKMKDEWAKDDITMTLSFIAGLPGEDEQSVLDTGKWITDNGFKSTFYIPLSLHNPAYKHKIFNKSEFERNCLDYGYRFPDENNNSYWENDLWTSKRAIDVCAEINARNEKNAVMHCWNALTWIQSGYTTKEIINTPVVDLDKSIYNNYNENFFKSYKEKFLRSVESNFSR